MIERVVNFFNKKRELEFFNNLSNYRSYIDLIVSTKETVKLLEKELLRLENLSIENITIEGGNFISSFFTSLKSLNEYKERLQDLTDYFKGNYSLRIKRDYISREVDELKDLYSILYERFGRRYQIPKLL